MKTAWKGISESDLTLDGQSKVWVRQRKVFTSPDKLEQKLEFSKPLQPSLTVGELKLFDNFWCFIVITKNSNQITFFFPSNILVVDEVRCCIITDVLEAKS